MKITVVGTGYVGLVTGVCLSEVGYHVTCYDVDKRKIDGLKIGKSPIYEPGLEKLMLKNIHEGLLHFTSIPEEGYINADIIYIAVGTPGREDGSADLTFIESAAREIAANITKNVIVVTKSTVPVGTNEHIKEVINTFIDSKLSFEIVSNPEFLREGSAIYDTFHGDRIVIGSDNEAAATIIEEINKPFGVPIFKTDIRSAELIKYASNAFLATKISFINEISNVCEKLGANIEDVAKGMGQDKRIGHQFMKAGIGYGGSCFPKDTHALVQIANKVSLNFELLKSVININNNQQLILVDKLLARLKNIEGKRIALLGLAFKPNTDDIREAASILIAKELVNRGARVIAYDPVAMENARSFLSERVCMPFQQKTHWRMRMLLYY